MTNIDLLDQPRLRVPNLFPSVAATYRIAFIGEAPGRDEEAAGEPFVGRSGRLLTQLMSINGLVRQGCFLGNVYQLRPPNDEFESLDDSEIIPHLDQLKADLAVFKPNLLVLMGNAPLKHIAGVEGITYWRGALLRSSWGYKCLPTYNPAAVLYQPDWMQILNLDLVKASREGFHDYITIPERMLLLPDRDARMEANLDTILEYISSARSQHRQVSIDIEGYVTGMSCLSIAKSEATSLIVPLLGTDNAPLWPEPLEERLLCALSELMTDPNVPKVLQNSLYDNFVLSYTYKMPIVHVAEDTMLKHWEAYCELPKSLGFQASIYTNQPPWKDEREAKTLNAFWRYCCTDSAVTYEISDALDKELSNEPLSQAHYRFNLALLHPLLYMELRGIRYDKARAVERKALIDVQITEENDRLAATAGRPINVNSPKFRDYLYDELGLPEVTNRKTGKCTANYEALLSLAKKTNHPVCHSAIRIRSLRTRSSMLSISSDGDGRIRCGYNAVGSETGRITCYTSPTGSGYNLQTIPEYDRDLFLADDGHYLFQCDLSGADGWTVAAHCARLGDPTMLQDLLSGVRIAKVVTLMFTDGPDVSKRERAELLTLTDKVLKTNPVYFGAKCCQHGTNYGMGHVLLSQTIFIQSEGQVNIPSIDAKRLQDLYLARYPGVHLWHRWCDQELRSTGRLRSASGHVRIFFGDRKDHSTLKAYLAHEPQANTTYATNLAALRLWTDPANRWGYWQDQEIYTGKRRYVEEDEPVFGEQLLWAAEDKHPDALIIEPLHQVHDALVGQFPKALLDWATIRIRSYFDNPITIAGQSITIPFEGAYGDSWGSLKAGRI